MLLAIETSCDETAAAVLDDEGQGIADVVLSQDRLHAPYGGVVPEIAARRHMETLPFVINEALERAGLTFSHIDHIAVTVEPGLLGALLVGASFALGLKRALNLPIIPCNHIEGHMLAPFVGKDVPFPFVALIVSGGHTNLYLAEDVGMYKLLGKTVDDAAGEAFDKVGRTLGLPYPSGPHIDRLSQKGNPEKIHFPRPLLKGENLNFSFSGLKTAVLNAVKGGILKRESLEDICASFQEAVVEVLVKKTILACEKYGVKRIVVSGGVSANSRLRSAFHSLKDKGYELYIPPLRLCTDNALMIGYAALLRMKKNLVPEHIKVSARSTFI